MELNSLEEPSLWKKLKARRPVASITKEISIKEITSIMMVIRAVSINVNFRIKDKLIFKLLLYLLVDSLIILQSIVLNNISVKLAK